MAETEKKVFFDRKKRFLLPEKITVRPVTEGLLERLNANPERKRLVEVRHMDVTYGYGLSKFKAVHDMSFNIYEGEVLGLVGESGSGKSTTGNALISLVKHSFGDIKINGKYLPKEGEKVDKDFKEFIINNVQMIFQDPANSLNPFVNIEQVVTEGLYNLKNFKPSYIKFSFKSYLIDLMNELKKRGLNDQVTRLDIFFNDQFDYLNEDEQKKLISFVNKLQIKDLTNGSIKLNEILNEINEVKNLNENQLIKKVAIDVLKSVGLDETVLHRYPLEFSGGQQQRIGISRAVAMRPKLLIADEPISALDVSIQAQVINIFKDLKAKYNLTILFIAHDLRMVEYISDRIAVMYKGILLEIGPTKEVVKNFLHPYTKSLMEAIPSIDADKKSLLGYIYDPSMHGYTKDHQPKWINLGNDHYILATEDEVERWKNSEY
ncbi:ABC transporter ATP-binding protein [Ureaplasma canigenitalium]|uniref:ABC transporter ATP-binding protein n=1 Tax=Ureaplasma canigenitalium TaxID=42092 RepID=UPI0004E1CB4C|nr:ABC transporter ATP-binding protein [Ureaplasma canigenitalium]